MMNKYCLCLALLVAIFKPNHGEELSLAEMFQRSLAKARTIDGLKLTNLNGDIHEEIWNGLNATKAQFPFQAIIFNNKASGSTICGASLISQRYVLTAAHCSYQTTSTDVYLGVTNTSDLNGVFYKQVSAQNTYVHPNYNPNNFNNDLAILDLTQNVTLTNQIQTIKLPMKAWAPPATFDNYNVTASGFGKTNDTEQGYHPILQWRTIHKMVHSACVTYYQSINQITDGMICTDKTPVYAGPCQGDSGGPLTVLKSNVLYLIGAVSWTAGNCSTAQPIVYANVPYYLSWINQRTGIAIS